MYNAVAQLHEKNVHDNNDQDTFMMITCILMKDSFMSYSLTSYHINEKLRHSIADSRRQIRLWNKQARLTVRDFKKDSF